MREVGELNVCGLVYRVFVASGDETPDLTPQEDGVCIEATGQIFIREGLSPSRKRDTLVHEMAHAFLEASGLREFFKTRVEGDYDTFEEAFIRLLVPSLMRFVDDNAKELVRLVKKGNWSK